MQTSQMWLDVVANNLANASTNGYKRDGLNFNDGLLRQMLAGGGEGGPIGTLGSGSVIEGQYADFRQGTVTATGNPLDLAILTESGAFAVQTPAGVRYTRDGAFQLNTERQIVDKSGRPLLDSNQQPITVPRGKIDVTDGGTVSVDGKAVAQIGVFTGAFVKEGGNLFQATDAKPADLVSLATGSLESSNVNAVEEMIAMIRLNRAFEMAQKNIQSQDESTERLISSLGGR